MIMYKKILSLSALTLALSLTHSNIALAHDTCNDGFKAHKVVKKLDLTHDQKTKIETIMAQTEVGMMRDRLALREIRKEVNLAFVANTMDDAQIDKCIGKKLPLIGDMMK